MRKLLLPICIVLLAALLLPVIAGKAKSAGSAAEAPQITTVSQAAFSMRSSGAEDATSRLVGCYTGEHGEKLNFDGDGEVRRIGQNLSAVEGSYTLLQSSDGASILDMDLGGQKLYSFAFTSQEGAFTLTDTEGGTETFTPVP